MTRKSPTNLAASVKQQLLNIARDRGEDFQLILTRFVLERFLYRLGRSEFQNQFVLKGAMLFSLWADTPHRATRDIDLLGFGESTVVRLIQVFKDICLTEAEEDGVTFPPESIRGIEIREDQEYDGVRITMEAGLGKARIPVQVDIGFGDAVTPAAGYAEYPTTLNFPAPHLRIYPRETVVAEKLQSMVSLGMANSRMKDFFDLWVIGHAFAFDGQVLATAIAATFSRRQTAVPDTLPSAFSADFSEDTAKQTQWRTFIMRNQLARDNLSLSAIITEIQTFLLPPMDAAARGEVFDFHWKPGGPWQGRSDEKQDHSSA
jgi:predicted nucleotidyltransferase component of viral defense system